MKKDNTRALSVEERVKDEESNQEFTRTYLETPEGEYLFIDGEFRSFERKQQENPFDQRVQKRMEQIQSGCLFPSSSQKVIEYRIVPIEFES